MDDVPPPHAAPRKKPGRRLVVGIAVLTAVYLVVLTAGVVAFGRHLLGDPGDEVPQPHRVAAKGPRPAPGESWAAPRWHWIALSTAWHSPIAPDPNGRELSGLVSDGKRAIDLRDPDGDHDGAKPATITAYDGGTGKKVWRTSLPWAHTQDPVTGAGVVIIPSGPESTGLRDRGPIDYVALDSATGARRWSAHAGARTFLAGSSSLDEGRPPRGGALVKGVFYYGDGPAVIGVDVRTGERRYRYPGTKPTGERRHPHPGATSTVNSAPLATGDGRVGVLTRSSSHGSSRTYTLRVFRPDLKDHRSIRATGDGKDPDRIMVDGDVLVVWSVGDLWATDIRTGTRLAHLNVIQWGDVTGVIGRTVVTHGLYDSGWRLAGYDLLTGRNRWSTRLDLRYGDMVEIADGTVLASGRGVSIVDPDTGKTVFKDGASHDYGSGPAAPAGGRLVMAGEKGITGYH